MLAIRKNNLLKSLVRDCTEQTVFKKKNFSFFFTVSVESGFKLVEITTLNSNLVFSRGDNYFVPRVEKGPFF